MKNTNFFHYIRYTVLLLSCILIQQIFIRYIQIYNFTPDIILIALFVIAVRLGQIPATIFGFLSGLLIDLFVGEVIGISALAKSISAFLAGYYFDEEKIKVTIRTPKFVLITLLCTFVHNVLYILAYIRTVDLDILKLFLTHGIGSTVYTSLFSILAVLIVSRMERKMQIS